jgi:hypothetical protein
LAFTPEKFAKLLTEEGKVELISAESSEKVVVVREETLAVAEKAAFAERITTAVQYVTKGTPIPDAILGYPATKWMIHMLSSLQNHSYFNKMEVHILKAVIRQFALMEFSTIFARLPLPPDRPRKFPVRTLKQRPMALSNFEKS